MKLEVEIGRQGVRWRRVREQELAWQELAPRPRDPVLVARLERARTTLETLGVLAGRGSLTCSEARDLVKIGLQAPAHDFRLGGTR